jgi:hypothetical protein
MNDFLRSFLFLGFIGPLLIYGLIKDLTKWQFLIDNQLNVLRWWFFVWITALISAIVYKWIKSLGGKKD